MIERRSIFRYFGLVPEGFKSEDARGIAVLCGLRVHRASRQQSGNQYDRASEPGRASTIVQVIMPPRASYISTRQSMNPAEKYIKHFMHRLIAISKIGRASCRERV